MIRVWQRLRYTLAKISARLSDKKPTLARSSEGDRFDSIPTCRPYLIKSVGDICK